MSHSYGAPDTDCFKPISNIGLSTTAKCSFFGTNNVEGSYGDGQKARATKGLGRPVLTMPEERPLIRIRTLAQGLLLAEQWGLHIESLKPWEKKTRVLPYLSPDKMKPIDQEDAQLYSGGGIRVTHTGTDILQITPELKAQCEAVDLHVPVEGTVIEIDQEVSKQMALKIAEVETKDPRSGDKVAALAALLGPSIANSHGKNWKGQTCVQYSAAADARHPE